MVQIQDVTTTSTNAVGACSPVANAAPPTENADNAPDDTAACDLLPSQERLLDAQDLERVAALLERPTARLHLTSLATKLRREAEALQRLEKSRRMSSSSSPPPSPTAKEPISGSENRAPDEAGKATQQPSSGSTSSASAASPLLPTQATASGPSVLPAPGGAYVPVDRFAFDAGGYNAPFVTLYVDMPGVGSVDRSLVTCRFTATSLDLVVRELRGKSYRLFKDNLEKDIDPEKSKIVVKSDRVVIKLAKVKSEYGSYDYWSQLTAKKARKSSASSKDDPHQSIMQLMKDMYDEGDDNMRKVIGETMLKQRRGELGNNPNDPMGGLGGMEGDDDI